jgi:1-acyl-sn-glycerol-3-phosphate acyltransferase
MLKFIVRSLWLSWCWLELSVFTLVLYILSWMPRSFTGTYYHKLSRIWCQYLIRALGVDLRLHKKNLHDIPKHYILIANHPSALEDFAIPALFDVCPLGKEGVRDWYFIGRIADRAGTVFVKREDPTSRHIALESLLEAAKEGRNIAIFPEGGCMGRRIYSSFQTGAFDISIQTGIPILPVFLHYEDQELFEWHAPHTLLHKFWHYMTAQNNRANYYVYDAISPEGFSDKAKFAEYVRKLYLKWQERYLD